MFELVDVPVLYSKTVLTPGNIEYVKIVERRYKDMLSHILPGDKKFLMVQPKREDDNTWALLVKVEEY